MSWYMEGTIVQCRRCFRNIMLMSNHDGFSTWRPSMDDYPQDCPQRRGEPCTPHQPE